TRQEFSAFFLSSSALGNVAEDQNSPKYLSLGILDWRSAIVNRYFGTVSRYQQSVICKADDDTLSHCPKRRILDSIAVLLVYGVEDLFQQLPLGLFLLPSYQRLCYRVYKSHSAPGVCRNHAISDA